MKIFGFALLAVAVVLAGTATEAIAGATVTAPEISPVSLSAGLALLTGGVLIARARLRK